MSAAAVAARYPGLGSSAGVVCVAMWPVRGPCTVASDPITATPRTAPSCLEVPTVAEVTPKGDPVSKAFRTYLALPDDTPLRIGMSVEANIVTRERPDALLVPGEAILDGAVFVVSDDRLKRVPVTTGIRGSRLVEITEGLSDGAVVASPAKPAYADGQRVRAASGVTP